MDASGVGSGVGRHAVCEFWGAKHLDSVEHAEHALRAAAAAGQVTLIDVFVHQFSPHGVSGIAVIAESHLALHSWPEFGYLAADLFTCGAHVDMDAIIGVLRDAFEADHVDVRFLERGVPPELAARRFEEFEPGSASHASYDMSVVLEQRRTQFQEVVLFESPRLGRVLALDGIVQMTDLDTYVYHEMLAHPALFSHPNPRSVAVVGGGDVHLVAEVLKHPGIERVYLLELDEEIVHVARSTTRSRASRSPTRGSKSGPVTRSSRSRSYAASSTSSWSTSPTRSVPPPGSSRTSSTRCASSHFAPTASSSPRRSRSTSIPRSCADCFTTLARRFAHTELLWAAIATYPGAFWTFAIASKQFDPRVVRRSVAVDTRLYDAAAHEWFFIPEPVRHRLLGV